VNILPKIGVDDIRLGMNKTQVLAILGKPNFMPTNDDEVIWEYEQGLELSFPKSDLYLLSTITVTSESSRLNSQKIIGLTVNQLKEIFPNFILDDDFEESGQNYASDSDELAAWITDGIVNNITIFPAFDKTGEIPLWPQVRT